MARPVRGPHLAPDDARQHDRNVNAPATFTAGALFMPTRPVAARSRPPVTDGVGRFSDAWDPASDRGVPSPPECGPVASDPSLSWLFLFVRATHGELNTPRPSSR